MAGDFSGNCALKICFLAINVILLLTGAVLSYYATNPRKESKFLKNMGIALATSVGCLWLMFILTYFTILKSVPWIRRAVGGATAVMMCVTGTAVAGAVIEQDMSSTTQVCSGLFLGAIALFLFAMINFDSIIQNMSTQIQKEYRLDTTLWFQNNEQLQTDDLMARYGLRAQNLMNCTNLAAENEADAAMYVINELQQKLARRPGARFGAQVTPAAEKPRTFQF